MKIHYNYYINIMCVYEILHKVVSLFVSILPCSIVYVH